jgi:hypothetical protein
MLKRILAVALTVLMGATLFGGCSSADSASAKDQQVHLDGTWVGEADGAAFTATVVNDTIKLDMKLRDTSGLYWVGTFNSNPKSGEWLIYSNADTDALKKSMFGSLDKTKQFEYHDDTIQFKFGIAGTVRDIALTKEGAR